MVATEDTTRPRPVEELDREFLDAACSFWHPVARSVDAPRGSVQRVTLLERDLVLWRGEDGVLGVADDRCPHRGARLSHGSVVGDCLRCPYHAWHYGPDGACRRIPQLPGGPIPPRARLSGHQVAERAGFVWACLAPPEATRAPLPECVGVEGTTDHVHRGDPVDWDCTASRNLDNFIDMAHFSIIHTGTFGNPDVLELEPYSVEHDAESGTFGTVWDYPVADQFRDRSGDAPETQMTTGRYRIDPPFTVTVFTLNGILPMTTLHTVSPLTARTCRSFWAIAFQPPEDDDIPDELVEAGQQLIYAEDQPIVEHQRPYHLPLARTEEVHCAFDKLGLAYRDALGRLGFPDGSTETMPAAIS